MRVVACLVGRTRAIRILEVSAADVSAALRCAGGTGGGVSLVGCEPRLVSCCDSGLSG